MLALAHASRYGRPNPSIRYSVSSPTSICVPLVSAFSLPHAFLCMIRNLQAERRPLEDPCACIPALFVLLPSTVQRKTGGSWPGRVSRPSHSKGAGHSHFTWKPEKSVLDTEDVFGTPLLPHRKLASRIETWIRLQTRSSSTPQKVFEQGYKVQLISPFCAQSLSSPTPKLA